MLPSQVISYTKATIALQGSVTPTIAILKSRSAPRVCRPVRQTRTFRIGLRSSYRNPTRQNEFRKRHRSTKYIYFELLNRKPSWNPQVPITSRQLGYIKNFMCSTSNKHDRKPSSARGDEEEHERRRVASKNKDNEGGDSLQALANAMKMHKHRLERMMETRARLFGLEWAGLGKVENTIVTPQSQETFTTKDRSDTQTQSSVVESETDYQIDPITNRRVYKNKTRRDDKNSRKPIDVPVKTYRGYRSQSEMYSAPSMKDPVRESLQEHERNGQISTCYDKTDGRFPKSFSLLNKGLKDYDSKASYGPVYHQGLDGKAFETQRPVREGAKPLSEEATHCPSRYQSDETLPKSSQDAVNSGLQDYDSKVSYGVVESPASIRQRTEALPASRQVDVDKTEDLDLLRASDVRAASGISKKPKTESESEKEQIRRHLLEEFNRETYDTPELKAASEKVQSSPKLVEELRVEHSELLNHAAHAKGKINAKISEVEEQQRPKPRNCHRLTGNYVRDFPEEFETKWSSERSDSGTLIPSTTEITGDLEQSTQTSVTTQPQEESNGHSDVNRIQTALDRSMAKGSGKTLTENIMPTTETEESLNESTEKSMTGSRKQHTSLVREIRGIYEDTYGTIDCNHRQDPQKLAENDNVDFTTVTPTEYIEKYLPTQGVAGNEAVNLSAAALAEVAGKEASTRYKILAYDPTMQSINEAETSSIVTDSASPLTPAEVLLRLSNPAKFFPHFAPLQAQGYEIVSGSGDVLVFRKVRERVTAKPKPVSEPSYASRAYKHRAMNPIDGMQPIVATGNFASPTGFVNHDLFETEHEAESEPPFKSNIDVKREEPVFSGRPNWTDDEEGGEKKKIGKGRRFLVGAVWVGACSYAIGVVAEFFKTGGVDGLGPTGF